MTNTTTFCLFDGRHTLPVNDGAICSGFDFDTMTPTPTPLWDVALDLIWSGKKVNLLVTGLTPALTAFIADANPAPFFNYGTGEIMTSPLAHKGGLTLLHYNNATGRYVPQVLW